MQSNRFPWFGIFLVLVGAGLLLERLHVFDIGWPRLFWILLGILGFGMVVFGFVREQKGKVFWGTVMFLYGVFWALREADLIGYQGHIILPVSLVIFGLAFVMRVVYAPRDWSLLIPAALFLGAGFVFIFSELGYIYRYDVWYYFRTYWPLALVAFGASLLFRKSS